jgi:hypothetical protein
MTKTAQPRSWATLSEPGRNLTIQKPEAEENKFLMRTLVDELNNLQKELEKLIELIKFNN